MGTKRVTGFTEEHDCHIWKGFVSTSNCSWSRFCCQVCFGIWRKGWNALECYLHSPMLPPGPEQQAKLAGSDTVSLNGAFSTISSFVSCLQLAWAEWPSWTIICQSHYFYQCYRHFIGSCFCVLYLSASLNKGVCVCVCVLVMQIFTKLSSRLIINVWNFRKNFFFLILLKNNDCL